MTDGLSGMPNEVSSDFGSGRMEAFGSWIFPESGEVVAAATAGIEGEEEDGVAFRRVRPPTGGRTEAAARPRRGAPGAFVGRGADRFRATFGGVAFRGEGALDGRLDVVVFPIAGLCDALGFPVTLFRGAAGASALTALTAFAGGLIGADFLGDVALADPVAWDLAGALDVDRVGFGGTGDVVFTTLERMGFGDGFPGDFEVLDREERGFWGISAGLGIRQADRWGSGRGRVDPLPWSVQTDLQNRHVLDRMVGRCPAVSSWVC